MSRKGKGKGRKRSGLSKESVTEQILSILSKSPQQGFNYKQIAKRLNISDPSEKQMISEILKELTIKETIQEVY
jgi:DNA-binding NarL/FixJ family response regulator